MNNKMERTQSAWIDIYPLKYGIETIVNDESRVQLKPELEDYCKEKWKTFEHKGWKSSWVAFASKMMTGNADCSILPQTYMAAGAMPFYIINGINMAIEDKEPFAPKNDYLNCLSVGFLTATEDAKVIFQRRSSDVHCPNVLIHEPCGYMSSLAFAPREECDNPIYSDDRRLFDLEIQLEFRKKEIAKTFGADSESVSYTIKQDFLAAGWMTQELYFSTTGKIAIPERKLKIPDTQEVFFVPFEYLKDLIKNQGRLSKINPDGYRPKDPREIPLIDESIAGLIWGYEKLTGERLNIFETIRELNEQGMRINVNNANESYSFKKNF